VSARPSSARVRLDPVERGDYDQLYALSVSEQDVWGWGLELPNPETFVGSLWRNILAQFVLRPVGSAPQSLGIVRAYSPNLHHGYCYFSMILEAEARGLGWPLEGAVLFLRYLFDKYPLVKIYAETTDAVLEGLTGLTSLGFAIEGRLTGHLLVQGQRRDYLIVALSRERFTSLWSRYSAPRVDRPLNASGLPESYIDADDSGFAAFMDQLADSLMLEPSQLPRSHDEADAALELDSLQRLELLVFLESSDPTGQDVPEALFRTLITYDDVYRYHQLRQAQHRGSR